MLGYHASLIRVARVERQRPSRKCGSIVQKHSLGESLFHIIILNSFTLHIIQWGDYGYSEYCAFANATFPSDDRKSYSDHSCLPEHNYQRVSCSPAFHRVIRTSRPILFTSRNHKHMKWLVEHQQICSTSNKSERRKFMIFPSCQYLLHCAARLYLCRGLNGTEMLCFNKFTMSFMLI